MIITAVKSESPCPAWGLLQGGDFSSSLYLFHCSAPRLARVGFSFVSFDPSFHRLLSCCKKGLGHVTVSRDGGPWTQQQKGEGIAPSWAAERRPELGCPVRRSSVEPGQEEHRGSHTLLGLGLVRCPARVGGRLSVGSHCESGPGCLGVCHQLPATKPGTECQVNMCGCQSPGGVKYVFAAHSTPTTLAAPNSDG